MCVGVCPTKQVLSCVLKGGIKRAAALARPRSHTHRHTHTLLSPVSSPCIVRFSFLHLSAHHHDKARQSRRMAENNFSTEFFSQQTIALLFLQILNVCQTIPTTCKCKSLTFYVSLMKMYDLCQLYLKL